jgi:hypothetical protein
MADPGLTPEWKFWCEHMRLEHDEPLSSLLSIQLAPLQHGGGGFGASWDTTFGEALAEVELESTLGGKGLHSSTV